MLSKSGLFLSIFISSFLLKAQQDSGMTNTRMHKILLSNSSELKGQLGYWEAYIANQTVYVVTDSTNNRMRIISPIVEADGMEEEQLKVLLEANFDRALDAKYSIYDKIVWSTFTHPLSELTDDQFVDALHQVVNLVNNFGTTFTSTGLIFGGDN